MLGVLAAFLLRATDTQFPSLEANGVTYVLDGLPRMIFK